MASLFVRNFTCPLHPLALHRSVIFGTTKKGAELEYLLASVYAVIFLGLIYRLPFFRNAGISFSWLLGLFLLKVVAGVLLSWVYTNYYPDRTTADVFRYFDDGRVMYEALFEHPSEYFRMLFAVENDNAYFSENYYTQMNSWIRPYETNIYNDSHTLVRFNAIIHLFSFGYFQVHTVFMCFLSLVGLTALYRAFSPWFPGQRFWLTLAIFGAPSVIFWGSGVLKEGLLFFAFGMLVFQAFRLMQGFRWGALVLAMLSASLLLILKFYILMALIPGLIAYGFLQWRRLKQPIFAYAGVCLIVIGIVLLFNASFPAYDIFQLLARKQVDFFGHASLTDSGSLLPASPLLPSLWGLIQNAPEAFGYVLLRPFPWEAGSALMWANVLENLLMLAIAVYATIFIRKLDRDQQGLLLFLASFVVILFLLVGWTTPVMGAIVRYKVPALPFYFLFFLLLIQPRRLPFLHSKLNRS